ncbi:hypothetical protein M885DRAFT_573130 [Pelagophyceae sp. CCMP2097]|nr:hypothetical protein M885DRAFT_573130 [Pelagophyceae sp. CCMP2097]
MEIRKATAARNQVALLLFEARLKATRDEFDAVMAAADDIEKELAGSRGDHSGQRAAHKRVAEMMGTKADDAPATPRQVRNAEGKMLYGRKAAEFIAAQYEER